MGPGGVTRDTATLAIRGIHPTHYGRICPIETPEAEEEENTKLAAGDLFVTPIGFLSNSNIPVRIGETFKHDDANRALMGSNMQRQAVPLIRPERPIVGTGLESRAVSDSGHSIQAKFSGVVTYVSAQKIHVTTLQC
eukprot:366282-Chlamydomonas_euryale.AAC.9